MAVSVLAPICAMPNARQRNNLRLTDLHAPSTNQRMDSEIAKVALTRALRRLGYRRATISDLVNGKSKPTIDRAAEIEREIGIPAAAWSAGVPLQEMWNCMTGAKPQ